MLADFVRRSQRRSNGWSVLQFLDRVHGASRMRVDGRCRSGKTSRSVLTALFSDVHSNLATLQACLRHARARRAERYSIRSRQARFRGVAAGWRSSARSVSRVTAAPPRPTHCSTLRPK